MGVGRWVGGDAGLMGGGEAGSRVRGGCMGCWAPSICKFLLTPQPPPYAREADLQVESRFHRHIMAIKRQTHVGNIIMTCADDSSRVGDLPMMGHVGIVPLNFGWAGQPKVQGEPLNICVLTFCFLPDAPRNWWPSAGGHSQASFP